MIQVKKGESPVSEEAYHRALHTVYRVWMITPQGSSGCLVEYEMDQEAIEEFMEDYTRFADIVVRIEPKDEEALQEPASTASQPARVEDADGP